MMMMIIIIMITIMIIMITPTVADTHPTCVSTPCNRSVGSISANHRPQHLNKDQTNSLWKCTGTQHVSIGSVKSDDIVITHGVG